MALIPRNEIKTYHSTWVKIAHWIGTCSFFFLIFSGFEILMVHPRLYWGETGNDLMPAFLEFPISRNYQHGGWTSLEPIFNRPNSPMSAGRTYSIFNENGWGRSLHFLAAWFLVFSGLFYLILAIFTGHIKNNLIPKFNELTLELIIKDIKDHLKASLAYLQGPQYGLLQKISYLVVIFILLPTIVLTGLTMSPAITASHPYLLTLFFGAQSARTIHFFAASSLFIFLIIHVWMIIKSGFKKQMLAMTIKK